METHNFNLVSVVGKVVQLWDLSEVASLGHESQPANKDIAVCAINTQGEFLNWLLLEHFYGPFKTFVQVTQWHMHRAT